MTEIHKQDLNPQPNKFAKFAGVVAIGTTLALTQSAQAEDFSVLTKYNRSETSHQPQYSNQLPNCGPTNPNTVCQLPNGDTITQTGESRGVNQKMQYTLKSPNEETIVYYNLRMSYAGGTKYVVNIEGGSDCPIVFQSLRVGGKDVWSDIQLDRQYRNGKFIYRTVLDIKNSIPSRLPSVSASYSINRNAKLNRQGVDESIYKN